MMAVPIIGLTNLSKRFGSTVALAGIDLTIDRPCIFGIVGPDGAGKTTLLRVLVGLLEFEARTATVLGYNIATHPQPIRARLGYVPQAFSLYPDLSVQHNLEFFAAVHGIPKAVFRARAAELLALAQLERFTTFLAASLSGGMKQKLALICALLHQPQVLVLDEPNNGVDVIARSEVWTILRQLRDVTIMISTNYLDEAARCDEVVYLYKGRIRTRGTPDQLKSDFPRTVYRVFSDVSPSQLALLRQAPWAYRVRVVGEEVTIETSLSRPDFQAAVRKWYGAEGDIEPVVPTLEMVFTDLTERAEESEE